MVIHSGLMIDGEGDAPIAGAAIRTSGDRIEYAGPMSGLPPGPPDEERIDATGCTVLPGLMNLHTHINRRDFSWRTETWGQIYGVKIKPREERREAASILQVVKNAFTELSMGVTTIRDLGTNDFLAVLARDTFRQGLFKGPRMISAGHIIVQTGGHGASVGYEADGVEGVRHAARYHIKMGCEWIKVAASGGIANWPAQESPFLMEYGVEELQVAAQEAHKRFRRACAHCYPAQAIKNCVVAGIDSIEHGCWMDEEAADMMARAGTAFVPTLGNFYTSLANSLMANNRAQADFKVREIIEPHRRAVELALRRNILVATGTDTNGNLVDEIVLLHGAGMTTMQAIQAATRNAARVLGLEQETGTLAPGKCADILVVEGNPLDRLDCLRQVRHVLRAGERVGPQWFVNLDPTMGFSPLAYLRDKAPEYTI
jgi:imidazolonepropionase-like amidohydrolase